MNAVSQRVSTRVDARGSEIGPGVEVESQRTGQFAAVSKVERMIPVCLRLAGIVVRRKSVEGANGVLAGELVVVADGAGDGVTVDVTRIHKIQEAIGTAHGDGAPRRRRVSQLHHTGIAVARSDSRINALVGDIVAAHAWNDRPEGSTDTRSPESGTTAKSLRSLGQERKLIVKLNGQAIPLKCLRESELLRVAVTLRTVRGNESPCGIVDCKLRLPPNFQNTQISYEVVVYQPTGIPSLVVAVGLDSSRPLDAGHPIAVRGFGRTQRRIQQTGQRSIIGPEIINGVVKLIL